MDMLRVECRECGFPVLPGNRAHAGMTKQAASGIDATFSGILQVGVLVRAYTRGSISNEQALHRLSLC